MHDHRPGKCTVDLLRLRAAGVLLTTEEAVAVLLGVCRRIPSTAIDADVPGAEEVRIDERGDVLVDPTAPPVDDVMAALAALMEQLLPPLGTRSAGYTVPASLRVLAPRARRKPGLAPLDTVGELGASLARYETRPVHVVLRELYRRALDAACVEPVDPAGTAPDAREPAAVARSVFSPAAPDRERAPGRHPGELGQSEPFPRPDAAGVADDFVALPVAHRAGISSESAGFLRPTEDFEQPGDAYGGPASREWSLAADEAQTAAWPPRGAEIGTRLRRQRPGRVPIALASLTLVFVGFVLGVLATATLGGNRLPLAPTLSLEPIARELDRGVTWIRARVTSLGAARKVPGTGAADRISSDARPSAPQATSGEPGSDSSSTAGTVPLTGAPPEPSPVDAAPNRPEAAGPRDARTRDDGLLPGQTMPLDTSAISGPAFSPSFGPDGTLLFHVGRQSEGRLARLSWDDDPSRPHVEPMNGGKDRSFHPRPSPDGRLIAFDSDRDGVRGIYVSQADGSEAKRVSGPGFASLPSWSPDMRWLAFIRAEPERPRVWNLWLRSLATGEIRRLTSHPRGQMWGASWFSDSRRLCYSHEDRLVVLDTASRKTATFRSPRAGRPLRTPAVAPDGRRVVFQVQGDGVWLLDLATQRMRRILPDSSAEEFAWDPTGRRFAYHSRRDGAWRIWLAAPPV